MAIFDGVMKAMGIVTDTERERAGAAVDEMAKREDAPARFAVAFARDLANHEPAAARRAAPSIQRPSSDPMVRRLQLAQALLADAERFVKHGDDRMLGPDLGRATREASLAGMASDRYSRVIAVDSAVLPGYVRSQNGFVADALERVHVRDATTVGRYLEAGAANEHAIGESARLLGTRERDRDLTYAAAGVPLEKGASPSVPELRDVAALAVARARSGILSPDHVARLALLGANEHPRVDRRDPMPVALDYSAVAGSAPARRIVPDFERGRHLVRNPLLQAEAVDGFLSSPKDPVPPALKAPAASTSRGPRDEAVAFKRAPAAAAAMAAARSKAL